MNAITAFFKRYPQPIFWGISYLTAWFGYVMSVLYPSDMWIFFVWGSFLGGALVTALADGRGGLRDYFGRIVRWRVGVQWYALALFLPLAVWAAAFALNIATGAEVAPGIQRTGVADLIPPFLFIFLTISLGEEPGFRGFALPRLLARRSALLASLILGVLHAIWHLPLFISGEMPVISTVIIILSGAVIFTWLFNHTRGSVLIAMILHTSVDLWAGFFNPMFTGADAVRQTIWLAAVYVAVAVLLRIVAGPELGRAPEKRAEMLPESRSLAAEP